MADQPFRLFIIYAREDEPFRAELKAQLLPMERAGQVRVWTDRELIAGEHWEPIIKQNLKSADVILLLVSSDYFQSDYIHEVEIKEALERHDRGEAKVLPIIVRPCDWEPDPMLSRLQVLPTDGNPVNDTRHWPNREAAWVDVVRGVRRTLQQLREERAEAERQIKEEEHRREEAMQRSQTEAMEQERIATERRAAEQQRLRATEEAERQEAKRRAEQEAREQAKLAAVAADHAAWQQAVQAGTTESYNAYLSAYPSGRFVREARKLLRQTAGTPKSVSLSTIALFGAPVLLAILLVVFWPKSEKKADTQIVEPQTQPLLSDKMEQDAWNIASTEKNIPGYRKFLQQYPSGPHAAQAKTNMGKLEQELKNYLADARKLLADGLRAQARSAVLKAQQLDPNNPDVQDLIKELGGGKKE